MAYYINNTEFLYNSYVEIDTQHMVALYNLAYQIFGRSFESKDLVYVTKEHVIIFFNSDIYMYELFLDYLKERNIPHSGNHNRLEVIPCSTQE